MKLTSDQVESVFRSCLFNDGEPQDGAVIVEGIVNTYGFHPDRLEERRGTIREMLGQLPEQFQAAAGGGWSFLNACNDKDGRQWTGLRRTMEMLFTLGLGLGLVTLLMPRDLWGMLPGGMPYYAIVADQPQA